MALVIIQKRNLLRYVWGFALIFTMDLCLGMTKAYRVKVCPQNKTEWQRASKRLQCSDDITKPINRYHCLPVRDLTTLQEFCYNETRPRIVKGMCMVYVQEKKVLDSYDCTSFKKGCPDRSYFSDEIYEFPECIAIDPKRRCYIAERNCQPNKNSSTDVIPTGSNDTSTNTQEDISAESALYVVLAISVIFVLMSVAIAMIWRYCKPKRDDEESKPFLDELNDEIRRLGIDYILHDLPKNTELFPRIAKELKTPAEILKWNLKNRKRYVESMKARTIRAYTGRVMVIGCAEAGKTTLVKKLKGETDLSRKPTRGIEIHPHEFKLDAKESTIIACKEQEKNKGCLCFTPTTLDHEKQNESKRSSFAKKEKSSFDIELEVRSMKETKNTSLREDQGNTAGSQFDKSLTSSDLHIDEIPGETGFDRQSNQNIDFSDCADFVNDSDLKMLSILDFAGQSAYYACHHIFLSRRAFYILVVDMSKDLHQVATGACTEKDLIYSNWTYADYIKYWMGSIHTYGSKTAPVILVASHLDKVDPTKKTIEERRIYFESICAILPSELLVHLDEKRMFFVDKHSDSNMKELKQCIALTLKMQYHWGKYVPLAWIKLESILRKLRKSSKIYSISNLFKDIHDLQMTREQLSTALKYFHETGVILFPVEINDNMPIILDVQWLINAYKCIIADKRHVRKNKFKLNDYLKVDEHGLLSRKLLDELWGDSDFEHYKIELISHMKHLDLLAELKAELWYVPCMNKEKYTQSILENCNVSSTLCFLFKFLPFVVFHRLVVACINKLGMTLYIFGKNECIYHTVAVLQCQKTTQRVLIGIQENKGQKYPYSIEIQAIETMPREIDSRVCYELKHNIRDILSDLTWTFDLDEDPFQVGYRCVRKPYSNHPQGNIVLENEMSSNKIDCSECRTVHEVDLEKILCFWKNPDGKSPSEMGQGYFKSGWLLLKPVQELSEISVLNVDQVMHISHVTSETIWFNNTEYVMKIDQKGIKLQSFRISDFWGSASHTVDNNGDVLLIKENKVIKMTSNGKAETYMAPEWKPLSIYSSKLNGDVLIRAHLSKGKTVWTKIIRYIANESVYSDVEYYKTEVLKISPVFLSENINGDICVSDYVAGSINVYGKKGNQRFSHDRILSNTPISPTGICNDFLGHILVCNCHESNRGVLLLDTNGKLISVILHDRNDIKNPWGLCVDDTGKVYVGQNDCNAIKVFRYLQKN